MAPKKQTKAKAAPETRLGLADLKPQAGATRAKLRVGRGRASGAGKTCNRGHNGEGQRSGRSNKRAFEGGQMPLFRRLPHVDGFDRVDSKVWLELNVCDLAKFLSDGASEITYERLTDLGWYAPHRMDGVRILGNGEIAQKVVVEAHHVTPSARQKIEAAGGEVRLLTHTKRLSGTPVNTGK